MFRPNELPDKRNGIFENRDLPIWKAAVLYSSPNEMYLSKLRAEEWPEHFLTSASVGHLMTLMLMNERLPV